MNDTKNSQVTLHSKLLRLSIGEARSVYKEESECEDGRKMMREKQQFGRLAGD